MINSTFWVIDSSGKVSPMPSTITPDGGGLRFNDGKPRYDLIPPEALDALATHFQVGARKYAERNWERGMSWGHCFAGLMRHAWAFWRGEEVDKETGTHHMIAAMWNCMALYTYVVRGIGEDTRLPQTKPDSESPSQPAPTEPGYEQFLYETADHTI